MNLKLRDMKMKSNFKYVKSSAILGTILLLSGCGGGSSAADSPAPETPSSISFNIGSAAQLQTTEDLIVSVSVESSSFADGKAGQLYYQVIKDSESSSSFATVNNQKIGSNLIMVDADGNASLAIDSPYNIKALYTISDPDGSAVYIALDTGWWNVNSTREYTDFLAQENCALLKVSTSDNTWSCVKKGVYLQKVNDYYRESLEAGKKPIQFDSAGNLYFLASNYERICDLNTDGSEILSTCKVTQLDWKPVVYQVKKSDDTLKAITQDIEGVDFYNIMNDGTVVYQIRESSISGSTYIWNFFRYYFQGSANSKKLFMYKNGRTIDLSTTEGWGVNFFATDDYNTVIWGESKDQFSYCGASTETFIRLAQINSAGSVNRASMSTKLFGGDSIGYCGDSEATLSRIVNGGDSKLYGVFKGSSYEWENNGLGVFVPIKKNKTQVYSMLPFDGTPKVQIDTIGNNDTIREKKTPSQIINGYYYYVSNTDPEDGLGTRDIITAVDLGTRIATNILDAARYQIYTWRLSGGNIFFSALDKSTTTTVTGQINVAKFKENPAAVESEYLTITKTASALGATSKIQDIEMIESAVTEVVENGIPPVVDQFYADGENIYSLGLGFSEKMSNGSLLSNISVTDDDATDIPYISVVLGDSMHMVPDTDIKLFNTITSPMSFGKKYTVSVGPGVKDAIGTQIIATTKTLNTRPEQGWYVSNTDELNNSGITEAKVAKYAHGKESDWWYSYSSTFDNHYIKLAEDLTNFRVEFSAKNFSWNGVELLLADYSGGTNGSLSNKNLSVKLEDWNVDIRYKTTSGYTQSKWAYGQNYSGIMKGIWRRYRVDVYGNNISLKVSDNGTDFTEVMYSSWSGEPVTNLESRSGTEDLLLRARRAVALDNVLITTLDPTGAVSGSVGDIRNNSFTGLDNFTDNDNDNDDYGSDINVSGTHRSWWRWESF